MKGLADAGVPVEEIHLNRKKLEHCRACGNGWGTCNKTGTCVIRDDFAELYEALAAAEVTERTVDETVVMRFSYEQMNLVMRVVKDFSPAIVSQDYEGNEVRMTLSLRQSLVTAFKEKFNINGRTVVRFES